MRREVIDGPVDKVILHIKKDEPQTLAHALSAVVGLASHAEGRRLAEQGQLFIDGIDMGSIDLRHPIPTQSVCWHHFQVRKNPMKAHHFLVLFKVEED